MVEVLGIHLKVEVGIVWQPDDAFFDLFRDRQVVNAMLAEVADKTVADGNVAEN
jgi:ParB family chromosome partitioning protein